MKAWVFNPHNGPAEIHLRRETVLERMKDELEDARADGWDYEVTDTFIYVDDGSMATLTEVIE